MGAVQAEGPVSPPKGELKPMPLASEYGDAARLKAKAEIVFVGTDAISVRDHNPQHANREGNQDHPSRRTPDLLPARLRRGCNGAGIGRLTRR